MDEQKPNKRGLRSVEVDFTSVKDKTIGEVFGVGVMPVTEISKKIWKLIREANLRVKKS